MKFTITQSAFLVELAPLLAIISTSRKNVNQSLACVRISTQEDRIEIAATDLELTLWTNCPATVERPGVVVVDVRRLVDAVSALSTTEIEITAESNGWIKLNRHFKIATTLPESFPTLPARPTTECYEIPAATLTDLINRVGFAVASKEDPKFTIHGALLSLEPGLLRMAALDGVVITEATVKYEGTDEVSLLIHRKALKPIIRLAANQEVVTVTPGANQHFFQSGTRMLAIGCLTGKLPNYRAAIPTHTKIAALDATQFMTLLRRVDLASPYVKAALSNNLLRLTAQSTTSEDEEEMAIAYDSEPAEAYVRFEKLQPFLELVKGETIAFSLGTELSPLVFVFRTEVLEHMVVMAAWRPNAPQ